MALRVDVAGREYEIRRTPLPQVVNGVACDYHADAIHRQLVVTDDAGPDELVARAAEAAMLALEMETARVVPDITPIRLASYPLSDGPYRPDQLQHLAAGATVRVRAVVSGCFQVSLRHPPVLDPPWDRLRIPQVVTQ